MTIRGYTCAELGVCNAGTKGSCSCREEPRMAVRHDTGALPAGGFYFAPGAIEHMPRRARRTAGQMVPMRRTTAVLLAVLCIELGALLLLAAGKAWH